MAPMIKVEQISKTFTLHLRGSVRLPVLRDVSLDVGAGECVILNGPSGVGKSTLLRSLYGNYRVTSGHIHVHHDGGWLDLASAEPRQILDVRRRTIGYVSQFLRVIPRVPAFDLVLEPMMALGIEQSIARTKAAQILQALDIPDRLWSLPPATFSGGEQQRINIARGFAAEHPILLLDEPTAALDAENRQRVVGLIQRAIARGTAIVGIFHDLAMREAVGTRQFELGRLEAAA